AVGLGLLLGGSLDAIGTCEQDHGHDGPDHGEQAGAEKELLALHGVVFRKGGQSWQLRTKCSTPGAMREVPSLPNLESAPGGRVAENLMTAAAFAGNMRGCEKPMTNP